MGLASSPLGLPRQQQRARANASRCATLARCWLFRGATAGSFASTAMAATLLSLPLQPVCPAAERHCPIRIIAVHLLDAAGQLLRVLFLDREGHISSQPHLAYSAEANRWQLLFCGIKQAAAGDVHERQPGEQFAL